MRINTINPSLIGPIRRINGTKPLPAVTTMALVDHDYCGPVSQSQQSAVPTSTLANVKLEQQEPTPFILTPLNDPSIAGFSAWSCSLSTPPTARASTSSSGSACSSKSSLIPPRTISPEVGTVGSERIREIQARIAKRTANIGKQPLDTVAIAEQCKRIMQTHGMSHRRFCAVVFGRTLSVVTFNRLLVKPTVEWSELRRPRRRAFRRLSGGWRFPYFIQCLGSNQTLFQHG